MQKKWYILNWTQHFLFLGLNNIFRTIILSCYLLIYNVLLSVERQSIRRRSLELNDVRPTVGSFVFISNLADKVVWRVLIANVRICRIFGHFVDVVHYQAIVVAQWNRLHDAHVQQVAAVEMLLIRLSIAEPGYMQANRFDGSRLTLTIVTIALRCLS